MPIYVYRNLTTGETFELEQRITESALTAHPETGDPIKRLIQPVGIAFKGSGFYVNDSRGSSKETTNTKKSDSDSGKSKAEGQDKTAKSEAKESKDAPSATKD